MVLPVRVLTDLLLCCLLPLGLPAELWALPIASPPSRHLYCPLPDVGSSPSAPNQASPAMNVLVFSGQPRLGRTTAGGKDASSPRPGVHFSYSECFSWAESSRWVVLPLVGVQSPWMVVGCLTILSQILGTEFTALLTPPSLEICLDSWDRGLSMCRRGNEQN